MAEDIIILILDDSQDDRELYWRTLKKVPGVSYRALEAEDGNTGLKIVDTQGLHCVLLDYSLPGLNGLDVLRKMRARHPFLPIIMLTGQGNEVVAAQSIRDGANHYLVKSTLTPDTLHRAIDEAISRCALLKSVAEKDREILEQTLRLEQSVAKLLESNAALERFAYICSHDLQEPLRMISNFTERLQKHMGDTLDEKGRHYMRYVTDGAVRARQLIDDVLNYARLDHESELLANVEAEQVLEGVLHDLSARVEETGASVTHDALPVVHVQPTDLRQLMQNLIANALKFCEGTPHIHIGAVREEAMWRFSVRDNGIGIAPEHLSRVFVIFQRLHHRDQYPGTGIGLAVCKKVAQKYGGSIWLESEPGKGSEFFFTLPPARAPNASEAA